jgi:hypothetical protein
MDIGGTSYRQSLKLENLQENSVEDSIPNYKEQIILK